ncbi:MAG TPA: transglycosylase domain-containing protein, partial [Longimicrobiales bacterium]|nr:transglycosylase domain-containing protein [Longimicrobiales bacterium]
MSDEHQPSADHRPERPPLRERLRGAFRRDEEGKRGLGQKLLMVGAGLAAVMGVVTAVLWFNCGIKGCPDVALLKGYQPDEASVIVDSEGEEVTKLFHVKRVVVDLDSLPEHVGQAFVAIEDQRFWEHGGVDWRRMFGAGWATGRSLVGAGGNLEGGSTITMQMAGNLFPERLDRRERTVWRKIGELRVAGKIEDEYTKEEILELYINQIYFGSSAWGVQAAAQEYFGKSASEVTLEEAALLAGLPKAPSRLSPRNDLDAARERRNLVLTRMEEQGLISPPEAAEARESDIRLARTSSDEEGSVAAYFVESVRRQLEEALGQAIYTGGYVIHTALNLPAQRVLETELERQLRNVEGGVYGAFRHPTYDAAGEQGSGSDYLQGAAVIMDATTGDVLALVGGRDFQQSSYNRATQA